MTSKRELEHDLAWSRETRKDLECKRRDLERRCRDLERTIRSLAYSLGIEGNYYTTRLSPDTFEKVKAFDVDLLMQDLETVKQGDQVQRARRRLEAAMKEDNND